VQNQQQQQHGERNSSRGEQQRLTKRSTSHGIIRNSPKK
jgi:hypothetical protein